MLRPGSIIALCVCALLMVGVIMVNSADMSVRTVSAEHPIADPVSLWSVLSSRSMVYMVIALVGMGCAALLPVRAIAAWAEGVAKSARGGGVPAVFGAISRRMGPEATSPVRAYAGLAVGALALLGVCGLVYVPGFSKMVNGSNRWIYVPGTGDALSIQPSEVAKWVMVGLVSWYCVRCVQAGGTRLAKFWTGLVPALGAVGAVAAFIVLEDLGTGALICAVAAVVLLAGGAKLWHFLALSPIPLAGVAAAILTSDYRMNRIMAFRDPYADPEGIGYHAIQSLVAVANGEGWGRGLGFGIQKLGYLPEDKTDFLFAVLCEELGIAGAAVVIALFVALLWAGLALAKREQSTFLKLVTLGVTATVSIQAVINLAVVTALAPTKGIALPLISSGGTGWVLTACSLGLLVAIDRTQPGRNEEVEDEAAGVLA